MSLMEWTQILGSVGEFAGAIAVVVTLLYLARQVRQSGRQVEHQVHLSSSEQLTKFVELAAASREVAEVLVKGRDPNAELTEVEALQFEMVVTLPLNSVEFHVRASEDPATDPDAATWAAIVGWVLDFPGAAEYWKAHRDKYFPEFVDWLEATVPLPEPGLGVDSEESATAL